MKKLSTIILYVALSGTCNEIVGANEPIGRLPRRDRTICQQACIFLRGLAREWTTPTPEEENQRRRLVQMNELWDAMILLQAEKAVNEQKANTNSADADFVLIDLNPITKIIIHID